MSKKPSKLKFSSSNTAQKSRFEFSSETQVKLLSVNLFKHKKQAALPIYNDTE
jgi:hypothetical protein